MGSCGHQLWRRSLGFEEIDNARSQRLNERRSTSESKQACFLAFYEKYVGIARIDQKRNKPTSVYYVIQQKLSLYF